MLRPTRISALALSVVLAVAAPAAAQDVAPGAVAPADGAGVTAGAVSFTARGSGGLVVRLAPSPGSLGGCEAAAGAVEAPGTPTATDPSLQTATVARVDAGDWYWQVVRRSPCAMSTVRHLVVAAAAAAPATPRLPSAPSAPGALPKLSRVAIPSRIGTSNHAALVLATGDIAPNVSRSRFAALVRNSAARWRLAINGSARRVPRVRDGHSDIGFNDALVPAGALAITITRTVTPVFVRTRCNAAGCTSQRRQGPSRVAERDVALRTDAPWEPGPEHPDRAHIDLETTLLHELGHVAGNRAHTPVGCHDTPMVKALAEGEWWRSSSDWSYDACGPGSARAAGLVERTIDHRIVVDY